MRISTAQMYQTTAATISGKQADLARVQNQLTTGKRLSSLADDPGAAGAAALLKSDLAANGQFEQNRKIAQQDLSFAEGTLGAVNDSLQSMRELLVSAGNTSFPDSDRKALASQLREGLATLIGLANTATGQGGYLFGGYREDTPPFVQNGMSVNYVADDGTRKISVSSTRTMATAFNGADVFMRIPNGNGVFTTLAAAGNTGLGLIDGGRVTNAAALTGNSYEIRFQSGPGGTTYDVVDTTTNTAVSSGMPFASPAAIALPGMSVTISGVPANGDKFVVAPSGNQDVFATISNAITLLETPANGNTTPVSNGLRVALTNVDQAISRVSQQRSAAGSRMNELDKLTTLGSTRDVDMASTLGSLEDIDYVKTISDFSVAQTGLQAALQSYTKIANTTLFDYLR
jgi:flagellar hook-associated protein 3 FlgL